MEQPIRWDFSYSVKIAELDHQHQRLFRTVAELEYAVRMGRADYVIDEVLEKVIEHTISHFAAEENLMEQYGFPAWPPIAGNHQMLAQKLTKFNLSTWRQARRSRRPFGFPARLVAGAHPQNRQRIQRIPQRPRRALKRKGNALIGNILVDV